MGGGSDLTLVAPFPLDPVDLVDLLDPLDPVVNLGLSFCAGDAANLMGPVKSFFFFDKLGTSKTAI